MSYLETYGRFANSTRDGMRKSMFKQIQNNADFANDIARELAINVAKVAIVKSVEQATKHLLNAAVAKAVMVSTVKGGVDNLGQRSAVFMINKTGVHG